MDQNASGGFRRNQNQMIMSILSDLEEVLGDRYYIHSSTGPQKAGITVGNVQGYDKHLLSHMIPENVAKILSSYLVAPL